MSRVFVERPPDEPIPWCTCGNCGASYDARAGHSCDPLGFWRGVLPAVALAIVGWALIAAGAIPLHLGWFG